MKGQENFTTTKKQNRMSRNNNKTPTTRKILQM
jgi:hypothetical protein